MDESTKLDVNQIMTFGSKMESCSVLRSYHSFGSRNDEDGFRVAEIMIPILAAKNISPNDLTTELDEEKSKIVQQA